MKISNKKKLLKKFFDTEETEFAENAERAFIFKNIFVKNPSASSVFSV